MLIAVAVDALIRCVLVHDDFLTFDQACFDMALGTGHIRVSAGQRQVRSRIVIKRGGHPAGRVVTIRAVSFGVLGHELSIVGILVASLALLWRPFKPGFRVGCRLVAVSAFHRSMGAQERKLCL